MTEAAIEELVNRAYILGFLEAEKLSQVDEPPTDEDIAEARAQLEAAKQAFAGNPD